MALGFVKDLRIDGGRVSFTIELTTPACPVKDQMRDQARAAVMQLPGVSGVDVTMTASVRAACAPDMRPGAGAGRQERHRGRRGQGRRGQDHGGREPGHRAREARRPRRHDRRRHLRPERADHARPPGRSSTADGDKIVPAERYGIQVVSMGFLTTDDVAGHLARPDAAQRHPAVLPGRARGASSTT